jgi:hypothetical protein
VIISTDRFVRRSCMPGQKEQMKNQKGQLSFAFIPASLFIGLALGWALGHFVISKTVMTRKEITPEAPQFSLRNRVHQTILAIDNALSAEQNTEYRKVLIEFAYRLTDLDLRTKLQKSVN